MNVQELINFSKHSSLPWLQDGIILLTKHGSQAYGLATPESDLDIKGIAIPPVQYFLGPFSRFEQAEGKNDVCEYVIYDIRKFVSLATDCNPNIIEILWTADEDIICESELGHILRKNKRMFLSKKAKFTFSGYAMAQLKRINTHKRWIMNPPQVPPTREDLGLPDYDKLSKAKLEAAIGEIQKRIDEWNIDLDGLPFSEKIRIQEKIASTLAEMKIGQDEQWTSAARSIGFDDALIAILDKERHYKNLKREYEQYQSWKNTRNEKRAALEQRYGYDTKHASHLVRLMRMCEEIMTTGEVVVRRPDREEILGIKTGSWSYEQIIEWAEAQDKKLDEIYKTSEVLPHKPNREAIEMLSVILVDRFFAHECKANATQGAYKVQEKQEDSKYVILGKLLNENPIVTVLVDPKVEGVVLPLNLMKSDEPVAIQLGLNLANPIKDFFMGSDGITGTLSFSRVPFKVFLPWDSIVGMGPGSPPPVSPGGGRPNLIALKGGGQAAVADMANVIPENVQYRQAA